MTEASSKVIYGESRFTDHDGYLFKEGNHFRLYERLGAHLGTVQGRQGAHFGVWAPDAERVSVCGDFNGWDTRAHPLRPRMDSSGIWEGFIPGMQRGDRYKYHVASKHNGYQANKGDPFGFCWEIPPQTASRVWEFAHSWGTGRAATPLTAPSPSTRSTSGPGEGPKAGTDAGFPTGKWPSPSAAT
jgi:1,4-alpha-glucan branching enzyme